MAPVVCFFKSLSIHNTLWKAPYSRYIHANKHCIAKILISFWLNKLKFHFNKHHWITESGMTIIWVKDHFVYASSQWGKILDCNVISHWLGTLKIIPLAFKLCSLHYIHKDILRFNYQSNRQNIHFETVLYWTKSIMESRILMEIIVVYCHFACSNNQ